jgi:hypothetical protein
MTDGDPLASMNAGATEEQVAERDASDRKAFSDAVDRSAKKEKKVKEKAPDPEPEPDSEAETKNTDDADSGDLDRDRALLILDGADKSIVDNASPEVIADWVSRVRARREKSETNQRELAELRKGQGDSASDDGSKEPASAVPELDLAAAKSSVDPLIKDWTELLGEESGQRAKEAFEALVESTAKATIETVTAQVRGEIENSISTATSAERARVSVRAQLETDYPSLSDDNMWATLERQAATLAKTGEYDGRPLDAFEHSARILQLQKGAASEADEPESKPSKRPKPTPSPSSRKTPPASKSKGDKDWAAYKWLQDHPGDVRGASVASGQ